MACLSGVSIMRKRCLLLNPEIQRDRQPWGSKCSVYLKPDQLTEITKLVSKITITRSKSPETDPPIHDQLLPNKGVTVIHSRKTLPFVFCLFGDKAIIVSE